MNLTNAALTRVDVPGASTPGGSIAFATGSTIAVRGVMDEPTFAQRTALGAVIADASAVFYVRKAALPTGLVPARGQRLRVSIDGSSNVLYKAIHVVNWEKAGGLSHYECFLKTE